MFNGSLLPQNEAADVFQEGERHGLLMAEMGRITASWSDPKQKSKAA